MYSKEDDKNLRISQIHHKKKENLNRYGKTIFRTILNTALAILIIGPSIVTLGSGISEDTLKIDQRHDQIEQYYQEEGVKRIENENFVENNGYRLVWNDEFSGTALNSQFWSPRYTSGNYLYTPANVVVSNGNLVFTATNEGGIVKYGAATTLNKYNFKYGYIEVRAKVAKGKGLTTGLWLTGQYHYPPEIDIMEHIGRDPNALYLSRHCNTNNEPTCDGWNQFPTKPWWLYWTKRYVENDWSLDYHLYGVEWTPYYIRWIIDGTERFRVNTGVSQEPTWITLSLCGNRCLGRFDGPTDSTTPFPSKAYIDYVRVYQKGDSSGQLGVIVSSPNGGENLAKGTTKTIRWSSYDGVGSYVKIELLKGGILNRAISSSTPNDGSFSWTIPPAQTIGTDYKVRITSTARSTHTDTSNNNFAISSPIVVVSPNGGDNWIRGTTKTVKWSYTGNPGSYVKVELLKGGVLNRVITSNTPIGSGGSGYYNWLVLSTQAIGIDYKIRVTSTSNSAYTDISNNYLKIY